MVISVRTEAGPHGLEVVKSAANDHDRVRLVDEADLLRRAAGPGVVPVIVSTVDELRLAYTGAPLHHILPLPTDQGVALVCAVADVVDHLHERGVAHGGVAAENVLVDDDGYPQLVGFGNATAIEERRSPEASDDVAGLGALLDRVLHAGQDLAWSPVHSGSRHRTRRKQAKEDLARIAAMAQRVDPQQRITARQFATAIRDALDPLSLPAIDARKPTHAAESDDDAFESPETIDTRHQAGGTDTTVTSERAPQPPGPSMHTPPPATDTDADAGDQPMAVARPAAPTRRVSSGPPPIELPPPGGARRRRRAPGGGTAPSADAPEPRPPRPAAPPRRTPPPAAPRDAAPRTMASEPPSPRPTMRPVTDHDAAPARPDDASWTAPGDEPGGPRRERRGQGQSQPPTPAESDDAAPMADDRAPGIGDRHDAPEDHDDRPGADWRRLIVPAALVAAGVLLAILAGNVFLGDDGDASPDPDSVADVADLPSAALGTADAWPAECELPTLTGPDLDGDGCPEPVEIDGREATVGGVQVAFGQDGDLLAVADVDCDGVVTPFLLRPVTGEIFQWEEWAVESRIDVSETTKIDGATSFSVYEGECDVLAVLVGDEPVVVAGA